MGELGLAPPGLDLLLVLVTLTPTAVHILAAEVSSSFQLFCLTSRISLLVPTQICQASWAAPLLRSPGPSSSP